jgi:hypothetical protein
MYQKKNRPALVPDPRLSAISYQDGYELRKCFLTGEPVRSTQTGGNVPAVGIPATDFISHEPIADVTLLKGFFKILPVEMRVEPAVRCTSDINNQVDFDSSQDVNKPGNWVITIADSKALF